MPPRTLYEKIWESHVVHEEPGQPSLIYIDRHLVHEGTSPQAFAGLKAAGRKVRRPELTFAVMDHSVSTKNRALPLLDPGRRRAIRGARAELQGIRHQPFDMHSQNQGIVHVIGPELGITQPGCTIVCGDSHTSTHGAVGALAFGIGTSEVEHVLATQCLSQFKSKTMKIDVQGKRPARRHREGHHPRDHRKNRNRRRQWPRGRIHGRGRARAFDGRPHDHVQHVHRGRRARRNGRAGRHDFRLSRRAALCAARQGFSGRGRILEIARDRSRREIRRHRHAAGRGTRAHGHLGNESRHGDAGDQPRARPCRRSPIPSIAKPPKTRSRYMDLKPGTPIEDIAVDRVFIGSCTNSRLEDLRAAAKVVAGKHVAKSLKQALVVPGSRVVKAAAEKEGLDKIFRDAGFEWRDAGCSMCIAHERRRAAERRALRQHFESQLRRAPGQGQPDAPGKPGHGRGGGDRRPLRGHPQVEQRERSRITMQPFNKHTGLVAPMDRVNVDTDQMVPKQFLKLCTREGFGRVLVLRLALSAGRKTESGICFELSALQGRERSDRARRISAADRAASMRRGRSSTTASARFWRRATRTFSTTTASRTAFCPPRSRANRSTSSSSAPSRTKAIALPSTSSSRSSPTTGACAIPSTIDPFRKDCLLKGLDDIGLTLVHEAEISAFEKKHLHVPVMHAPLDVKYHHN